MVLRIPGFPFKAPPIDLKSKACQKDRENPKPIQETTIIVSRDSLNNAKCDNQIVITMKMIIEETILGEVITYEFRKDQSK